MGRYFSWVVCKNTTVFWCLHAGVAKPYVDRNGEQKEALRYVAKQPLKFSEGGFNRRKLMQLPYHLIQAGDLDTLKKEVLCNYEFLLTKVQAVSLRLVL